VSSEGARPLNVELRDYDALSGLWLGDRLSQGVALGLLEAPLRGLLKIARVVWHRLPADENEAMARFKSRNSRGLDLSAIAKIDIIQQAPSGTVE
jgi:hypothetical protein